MPYRPLRNNGSFSDLSEMLSSGLNLSISRPGVFKYVPHPKQVIFHKSKKRGRQYIGGNRSGKTVGGIVEDIWWLMGNHPFIDTPPPPIQGRIVTVDFENGWELIIKPVLQTWLPRSALINGTWEDSWSEKVKVLTLANGSRLDIMSYQQQTDKHAGSSRHFVHFDEEPPSVLFKENMARLVDTDGRWWLTMTPVEGMTWTYDTIYNKSVKGTNPYIDVIKVKSSDNPHLSESVMNELFDNFDEDESKIRKEGEYVQVGGLILKDFDYKFHIIPAITPPRSWPWFASFDHGYNNPTSWHYHALAPDGTVITFFEHYKREMTIIEHAKILREADATFGRIPDKRYGDPAIKQRLPNTGKSVHREYLEAGIPIITSNNDKKLGIDQLIYRMRSGKWLITENNTKLIWEALRYRWKTRTNKKLQEMHGNYDEPHDKDNHAMDDSRYLFINLRLSAITSSIDAIRKAAIRTQIEGLLNPVRGHNIMVPKFDTGLYAHNVIQRDSSDVGDLGADSYSPTDWTDIDDSMGGLF